MPKFNRATVRTAPGAGPMVVQPGTEHRNHEGGVGFTRDPKSDVFLLATTSLDLTANAFYERGDARVIRFTYLIGKVAVTDPDWTFRFLTWLRTKGNIRTAAVVGGVEAARAMAASGIPGGRHMVSTVLRRADEPGEAIAYHHTTHGRKLPMAVKRGIGDAVQRLYNERSVLKYDTASHALRFADVLAICHPSPADGKPWQGPLFQYVIDRRYGRDDMPEGLHTLAKHYGFRQYLARTPKPVITADRVNEAAMTWEDLLSALGNKVDKAELWRALIPSMGFMARLRNLRNFDQAGLTDADVRDVVAMLSDPEQVAKSKQLPLRFLSAYRAAGASLRWAYPLSQALDLSLGNIPHLTGRTLIMVDTSQSMRGSLSGNTDLMRWDAAAAFGLALAKRCEAVDVVSYSGDSYMHARYVDAVVSKEFPTNRGEALLKSIERWGTGGYFIGQGTNTAGALRRHYRGHDRVVLLTDEQNGDYGYDGNAVSGAVPADRPMYTWNLAGYRSSHAATDRNRITLGGLTDHMFALIPTVEKSHDGGWPWAGDPDIGALPTYETPPAVVTRAGRHR